MNRSRLHSLILVSLVTVLVGGGFAFAAPKQARADALGDFIQRMTLGDFIRSLFGLPPAGSNPTPTPTPTISIRGNAECENDDGCPYGKCCNSRYQCVSCSTHPAPTNTPRPPTATPPGGHPTDIPPHPVTNTPPPPGATNTPRPNPTDPPATNTPRPTATVTFRPTATPRPVEGTCTEEGAKRCSGGSAQICAMYQGQLIWGYANHDCSLGCANWYPRCNTAGTAVTYCSTIDSFGCCSSAPQSTQCSSNACRDGQCLPASPTGTTPAPTNTPVPNAPTVTTGPGTPTPTPAPTNTPVPNPTNPPGGGGSTPVPTQPPVNTPFPTDTPTPLYSSFNAWFADFLPYVSGTGGTSTSLTVLEDWRNNAPLPGPTR